MKLKLFLSVIVTLCLVKVAFETYGSQELCEGFVPPNDLKISAEFFDATQGGITHAEFDAVLDRVQKLYAAEIKALGGELVINRLWDDGTVNASAQQIKGKWILNMYGGLARHPETTKDGFAVVVCHEMGHHMGGAPKYKSSWLPIGTTDWASNEGQADYYSTLKCMRRYFAEDTSSFFYENKWLDEKAIDPTVDARCHDMFTNTDDRNYCVRGTYAGLSTAKLLNVLNKGKTVPAFNTPDKTVLSKTNDSHPAAQCRLDTYFAAATCSASVSERLSNTDYKMGTCYDVKKTKYGLRPQCWFSTKKSLFPELNNQPLTIFY